MGQAKYKTHIQREKPAPVRAGEAQAELAPDIDISSASPSERKMRWSFYVWLAGFLLLAAWMLWDLIVALLFRW